MDKTYTKEDLKAAFTAGQESRGTITFTDTEIITTRGRCGTFEEWFNSEELKYPDWSMGTIKK